MKYPLAPNAVFRAIQGEGHLRGTQMVFVRLAGCSVGCPECDTDYSVARRADTSEIISEIREVMPDSAREKWVWITGGEPADRPLGPLIRNLRRGGYSVAVASSGSTRISEPVDWLSISPHSPDFAQKFGHELKLIDALNGVVLEEAARNIEASTDFFFRYVQPLSLPDASEDPASLARCIQFLHRHPNWSLSRQDHHHWRLP